MAKPAVNFLKFYGIFVLLANKIQEEKKLLTIWNFWENPGRREEFFPQEAVRKYWCFSNSLEPTHSSPNLQLKNNYIESGNCLCSSSICNKINWKYMCKCPSYSQAYSVDQPKSVHCVKTTGSTTISFFFWKRGFFDPIFPKRVVCIAILLFSSRTWEEEWSLVTMQSWRQLALAGCMQQAWQPLCLILTSSQRGERRTALMWFSVTFQSVRSLTHPPTSVFRAQWLISLFLVLRAHWFSAPGEKKTSTVSIEGSVETASRPPFKAAVVVAGSCFILTPTWLIIRDACRHVFRMLQLASARKIDRTVMAG